MCGRFALGLDRGEIRGVPGYNEVDVDEWIDEDKFVPRYNIGPRTYAPVLRRPTSSNGYILHTMKWGLVPHWSKYEDKTLNTINARSENLVSIGGMWASVKGRKRCAVLAQGYYEWLTRGKDKQPHFTKHRDGALMLIAGLYEFVVLEGQAEPLWTFTIVTTAASKEFEWLHHRQPVILSTHAALDAWLDASSDSWTPTLSKLVQPSLYIAHPLECFQSLNLSYRVPKQVGKIGFESPSLIEPLASLKDRIQAVLSKQVFDPQPTSQSETNLPNDCVNEYVIETEIAFASPAVQPLEPGNVSQAQAPTPQVKISTPFNQLLAEFPRYSSRAYKPVDYLEASLEHLSRCLSLSKMDRNMQEQWKNGGFGSILFPNSILYLCNVMDTTQLPELYAFITSYQAWDLLLALCRYREISDSLRPFVSGLTTHGADDLDAILTVLALDVDMICVRLHGLVKDDLIQYRRLVNLKGAEAQALLDLFQLLLDLPKLDTIFRSPFLNAILRLSSRSGLFPTHFLQEQVSLEGADPIAAGQFGDVWKGQFRGQLVAVKVLKLYANSDIIKHTKKVLHETLIWRQLRHPNVLSFLCLHHVNNNEMRLGLVSPWMKNGNLKEFLACNSDADHISLMNDVAKGLEYLHTMEPIVVHGDLKAVNILISDSCGARLADFGLSTASDSQALMLSSFSTGPNGGTPRWMAPELLDGRQEVNNTQTDVYAFAYFFRDLPFSQPQ
ncbi:hypothetical protein H0H87_006159 [Tephrocybe sp. NHM501043]|nr:hypothetical protein H0H87_006159 [Tephrocybe sp. NHM501043]